MERAWASRAFFADLQFFIPRNSVARALETKVTQCALSAAILTLGMKYLPMVTSNLGAIVVAGLKPYCLNVVLRILASSWKVRSPSSAAKRNRSCKATVSDGRVTASGDNR